MLFQLSISWRCQKLLILTFDLLKKMTFNLMIFLWAPEKNDLRSPEIQPYDHFPNKAMATRAILTKFSWILARISRVESQIIAFRHQVSVSRSELLIYWKTRISMNWHVLKNVKKILLIWWYNQVKFDLPAPIHIFINLWS
jgi:hypothetical protein